jgi:tetratricopeptide (TPR) repeat protein
MKKNVIFLISLTYSLTVIGQHETQLTEKEIEEVEVTPPKFTAIENQAAILEADNTLLLQNYLIRNIDLSGTLTGCLPQGTEMIRFTVTPSGNVSNLKVVNSICPKIDNELIRVLKTTNGMWKPGYINGEPSSIEREVSVLFAVGEPSNREVIEHFTHCATSCFKKGSMYFLVKNNPKKALKFYNESVRYLPNDLGILLMRGLCYYELGDTASARKDWNRILSIGGIINGINYDELALKKGYTEMTDILANKDDQE